VFVLTKGICQSKKREGCARPCLAVNEWEDILLLIFLNYIHKRKSYFI
jgi:hypothetical protein